MIMFTSKKRLAMRQRIFATTAAFVSTMLMALAFQNCSGGASTGNGGGYGGGLGIFPSVKCVTDQNASDGKPVELVIDSSSDVQSYTFDAPIAEYINPNFILQVDLTATPSRKYQGQLDFIDNGTMRSFTVQCE